jgi:aspartyl-tRNA(Asn)/glutamyl-tRNA(Gln) amidotransferase subunit B
VANTQTSPLTLGHPGTLPKSNKKVIEYAVKMGIACGSTIREHNEYARKNYFYPDLPKGYQITQDTTPICNGGVIYVKDSEGNKKAINITRIHMEEDAGKSIHDLDPFNTLVDLNRAGVALIEIVSNPDISSSDEAYQYLTEVRKLVRYLDICDGNLEEGSLRCDANISVMLKGSTVFGNRAEVKNMNSLRNVKRAIEYEMDRQIEVLENGGTVLALKLRVCCSTVPPFSRTSICLSISYSIALFTFLREFMFLTSALLPKTVLPLSITEIFASHLKLPSSRLPSHISRYRTNFRTSVRY